MLHRMRHTHIKVPNAGNAKMMRTRPIRPFRRGEAGGGEPWPPTDPDVLWAGEMTLGQSGANYGYHNGSYGGMTPSDVEGSEWFLVRMSDINGNEIHLRKLDDTQLGGGVSAVSLEVRFQSGTVTYDTLPWVLPQYQLQNTADAARWLAEVGNTVRFVVRDAGTGAIITGGYDLTVGDQGTRVGLTNQVGSIAPAASPSGFVFKQMHARTANGNVVVAVDGYDDSYTGGIDLDFGVGPDVDLTYDGNGKWVGNSPAFLAFLQANIGNTVNVFLSAD